MKKARFGIYLIIPRARLTDRLIGVIVPLL